VGRDILSEVGMLLTQTLRLTALSFGSVCGSFLFIGATLFPVRSMMPSVDDGDFWGFFLNTLQSSFSCATTLGAMLIVIGLELLYSERLYAVGKGDSESAPNNA
jgi:hypothetical protein